MWCRMEIRAPTPDEKSVTHLKKNLLKLWNQRLSHLSKLFLSWSAKKPSVKLLRRSGMVLTWRIVEGKWLMNFFQDWTVFWPVQHVSLEREEPQSWSLFQIPITPCLRSNFGDSLRLETEDLPGRQDVINSYQFIFRASLVARLFNFLLR